MSYIDNLVSKQDLFFNDLKPNRNLIIFIIKPDVYLAYTLTEMKEIIKEKREHHIKDKENTNRPISSFFHLPIKITIDISLEKCFYDKSNTLKLVKSENKYIKGFGTNEQFYSYYSVTPVLRNEIGSNELSTFFEDEEELTEQPFISIDWNEIKNEQKRRQEKQNIQIKICNQERKDYDYDYDYDCVDFIDGLYRHRVFTNSVLRSEIWTEEDPYNREGDYPIYRYGEIPTYNREDDLPAITNYNENGEIRGQYWYKHNLLHREGDLPARMQVFFGRFVTTEYWRNGSHFRENDKPTIVHTLLDGTPIQN